MACRYCFVHQNPETMTYAVAKDAADFLAGNAVQTGAVPNINFFGGEPTLCWDSIIKPLTGYIRGRHGSKYTLSMTTNGTLLGEERLRFMADNDITMLLSIDGDRETQAYNRPLRSGENSFDALEPLIDLILKYRPATGFRATTMPDTCGHLMENLLFAERRGFPSYFTMPDDFGQWTPERIAVLRQQVGLLGDYFVSRCREGRRPLEFTSFEKMFHAIRLINQAVTEDNRRDMERCRAGHRCGLGGTSGAAIDPSGRIFSCQDLSSFSGDDSPFYLGTIYGGADDERRYALMRDYDCRECIGLDCKNCRLDRICDGGCVANNYMFSGDIRKAPPIHCIWYQMLLEEAIRVMDILGPEENTIFAGIWGAQ